MMEQKEFYEVNGCEWFIPVKLIEIEEDKYTKTLEVEAIESGCRAFVPSMYKFERVEKPQKVVVPKFVAEWVDKHKNGKKKYRLSHALENVFDDTELGLYTKQQEGDYTETLARAWLAYPNIEVEPEELYTVEIPNPNDKLFTSVLTRIDVGIVIVRVCTKDWMNDKFYQLTEAEIKKDFEWAWKWAKPVEEE